VGVLFIITSIPQMPAGGRRKVSAAGRGSHPWEWERSTGWKCRPALLLLVGCVDDIDELVRLQGSAADEAAVHIGLSQQLCGVLGVHGAAVLDGNGAGHPGAVEVTDGSA